MAGSKVKTFDCPACGGVVSLRAAGHSITAVCTHCSSVIDTANDNFKIILKHHQNERETDIPLGAKGVLDHVKWEVIGYVEKRDISGDAFWEEYLLFNPYFGFRFLVHGDGHWNLARVLKRDIRVNDLEPGVFLDDQEFHLFYRSTSIVEYVKGEFYWRVRKGDKARYADYIAPPRMLSVETSKQERTLSLSEYLLPGEVEQAFGVSLPGRTGVAPNQPPAFANTAPRIWWITAAALLAAFLVQINIGGQENILSRSRLHIEPAIVPKSLSTPVFYVPRRANLVVEGSAPLTNNWMDIDLSLVNDNTNTAYSATQAFEFYSGVDGGEFWSEGSTQGETWFSAVEDGTYRLVVEPSSGAVPPEGMDLLVQVKHDVPIWGNFWFIVVFILVVPLYVAWYRRYFEHRRWSNSDYAPTLNRVQWDE